MKILLFLTLLVDVTPQQSQHIKSDSLLSVLLRHAQQDTVRVNLLNKVTSALSNESNFTDAITMQEEALTLADGLGYTEGIAKAKLLRGIIHYKKGEFQSAIAHLQHAVTGYEKSGSQQGIASSHHWLGNSYYAISEFNRALEDYVKAYAIREKTGDKKGMAIMLANIGNIYYDQQEYEKAIEYHTRALALKKDLSDERSLAVSYNNIGNNYAGLKQYDEARKFYKDALAIFERTHDARGTAYTLGSVGMVYEKQGQYMEALASLGKAVALLEKENDQKGLAEAYNHIGEIEMRLRLYRRAEVSLLRAQELAEEAGVPSELMANYERFARLDSAMGNMAGAYTWMKHYTHLKEKIFNREQSTQITQMQAAFDAERKDRTIQLLAKEKNYQERQKVTQRVLFASGILVLVLILFGLLYFLRQKHKTNRILKAEKAHSEELNRLKDKLFSIIAHDLRGPLNSLKALLGLAAADHISEAELKYLLGTIGQNTQYTTNLVDNLLVWAKENLHGSTLTPQYFDLNSLIEENIKLLTPQAEKKDISLRYTAESALKAHADRNMIDLVLRNILSNAIKFTPQGGTITVSVAAGAGETTVSIADTGLGIKKECIGKLFGKENFSTPGTENEKGTGLGLILCREFIEKNGGKIWVKSTAGSGSIFAFTIPAAKTADVSAVNVRELNLKDRSN